jgi:hypothetical protein
MVPPEILSENASLRWYTPGGLFLEPMQLGLDSLHHGICDGLILLYHRATSPINLFIPTRFSAALAVILFQTRYDKIELVNFGTE